jgi:putative FmdB family regulatory protein
LPTYQYSCTECGHFFEQFQSFSDDALTVCPQCEGRLRKVFNAVGVVFKGSGFYRTDSRAGAGAGANGDSGAKSDSGAKGDSAGSGAPAKEPAAAGTSPAAASSGSSSTGGTASREGSAA